MSISRSAPASLALCLMAACSSDSTTPPPVVASPRVVSAVIRATEGGTIEHPDGARLVIPRGGLTRDTTITIENQGVPSLDPRVPVVPGSRRFAIDLGGADAALDLELGLDILRVKVADRTLDASALVLFERASDGTRHAHSVAVGAARRETNVGFATRKLRAELTPSAARPAFELGYALKPTLPAQLPLLDVPYYSQDGLNWCVPSSAAMVFRYFQGAPGGETVSNWWLAGKDKVPRDAVGGVNPESLMHDAGIDPPNYTGIYWDMDLLEAAPFKNYAQSTILGNAFFDISYVDMGGYIGAIPVVSGPVPPRPLLASSHVPGGLHAYVIVGADDEGARVNDASGALTGEAAIATPMTWAVLKQRVGAPSQSPKDIWTAVMNLNPRPPENRHGSIVMLGGANSSLTYTPLDTTTTYKWLWGGDPYKFGAYWDGPNCFGGPTDSNWKCALPLSAGAPKLSGTLAFDLYVANVTAAQRSYDLQVAAWDGGHQLNLSHYPVTVPGRSWSTAASRVQGTIPVSAIQKAGLYAVTFALFEDNQAQDLKTTELPVK